MTWAKCGHDGLIDGSNRCHHWRFVESRMYLQITCSVFQLPHDSAVFPVFPTVPAWFAYHSNSLQITSFLYKTWAKCGHGWARVAHQIIGRLRHFYKRV